MSSGTEPGRSRRHVNSNAVGPHMKLDESWLRVASIFCIIFMVGVAVVIFTGHHRQWHDRKQHVEPFAVFGMPDHASNILVMGVDLNYTKQQLVAHPDTASFNGRTDSMILVHVDPAKGIVGGLHIPRDTSAAIPGHGVDKINAANAYGGPHLAEQAVADLTSVAIDHYFIVNLQGLINCVNELGGITLEVPKKMSYMDWTAKLKINLDPGVHTLTGNQAMGFVRFRHDELGDIGRIQRQQIFMRALTAKLATPTSWSHFPRLLQILRESVLTDLSDAELFQMFNYVRTVPRDRLQFAMLPGRFGSNGSWIADPAENQKVLARLFGNDNTASERRTLTVSLMNVSSYPGLEDNISVALRKSGYSVVILKKRDHGASLKHVTRIIAERANASDAAMVRTDLGNRGEIVNSSIGDIYSHITVMVDDDLQPLFGNLQTAGNIQSTVQ